MLKYILQFIARKVSFSKDVGLVGNGKLHVFLYVPYVQVLIYK